MEQTLMDKLTILADSAKYDVACTSSGASRTVRPGTVGRDRQARRGVERQEDVRRGRQVADQAVVVEIIAAEEQDRVVRGQVGQLVGGAGAHRIAEDALDPLAGGPAPDRHRAGLTKKEIHAHGTVCW